MGSAEFSRDDFGRLDAADRDAAVMRVERELRRLQAQRSVMISVVEAAGTFPDDGHRNVTAWLQAVTNGSYGRSSRLVRTARMMAALPSLAAAVEAGELGDDQVGLLLKLFANPRCRQAMLEWESKLVEFAGTLVLPDFTLFCQRWEQVADPDGVDHSTAAARAARSVSVRRAGELFELAYKGDAMSGDVLEEVLNAFTDIELDADVAARRAEHGADADRHALARSTGQRRADALLAIVLLAGAVGGVSPKPRHNDEPIDDDVDDIDIGIDAESDDGTDDADEAACDASFDDEGDEGARENDTADDEHGDHGASDGQAAQAQAAAPTSTSGSGSSAASVCSCGGRPARAPEPLVNIFCTQQALEDAIRHVAGDETWTVASSRLAWSETASGAPVSRQDLFTAALIGQVRKVVNNPYGRIINLGRKQRLFTGAAREAAMLAGRRCSWLGDGIRTGHLHIDHRTRWAGGPGPGYGRTDQDNAEVACGFHNLIKEALGITVVRDRTGLHFFRADGTEIAPRHETDSADDGLGDDGLAS